LSHNKSPSIHGTMTIIEQDIVNEAVATAVQFTLVSKL